MISVSLTFIMLFCASSILKADAVMLRKAKHTGGVRSILLDPSHLTVNLDDNVIHVDFLLLLRDVNVSVSCSDGRQVYQQTVFSQASSVDIDLSGEIPGAYTIYFTDATGVCLYGELTVN